MRALFKSPQLQADFDRDGFVVVPFLSPEQVDELRAHYASLDHNHKTPFGFHVSMDNADPAFVQGVMDKLSRTAQAQVDTLFDRAKVFVASYVVKEPGPRGTVPPHQDWTFVDESRFVSCTVWIPLQATTVDNGALGAIRGSHKLFDHVRASPSPQCPTPIGELMFQIFPYAQIQEMQPGQAFIFNNKTLHASPPNMSGVARVAAGIGITHEEAELVHHYLLPDTQPPQIACYRVDTPFFHRHSNGRLAQLYQQGGRPEGVDCLGTQTFEHRRADAAELARWFERDGNHYDQAMAERLARLMGQPAPAATLPATATAAPTVPAAEAQVSSPGQTPAATSAATPAATPAEPAYHFHPEFPPMPVVMRDPAHQAALARDGYVVVDLLDAAQLARLKAFHAQAHAAPVSGFYASTFAADTGHRAAVDREIRAVCSARIAELTQDTKTIFGSFIVKASDEASQMNIHQDMTLVDENHWAGINIWCPLVDLTPDNGALQLLPGSHRLLRSLRGATIPAIYDGMGEALLRRMRPLYLKAGQAVVFDQSIIHWSPANRSGAERVVINVFFTHRDARMLICHHDRSQAARAVEVFEVDDRLLHEYTHFGTDIHARPQVGRSLGRVAYGFHKLSAELLDEHYPDTANASPPAPALPASAAPPDAGHAPAASAAPVLAMTGAEDAPAQRGWRAWLRRLVAA